MFNSPANVNIVVGLTDATKAGTASVRSSLVGIQSTARAAGVALKTMLGPLIAITGLTAGFYAVTRFVSDTVKVFAEYDDALRSAAAVTGATAEEMQKMNEAAQRMGRTTRYTASQSASALRFLGMAGFDATQSVEALPGVLQLAAAGALDLGTAADIATNILTGFGLEVEQLGQVNDVMVKAFTNANVTLAEVGDAFKYVAPIARGVGAEFEDLVGAIARMGDAGIKGSMAGTALRGALSSLLSPTAQEKEMMEMLGQRIGQTSLQVKDAEGNFVGFVKVVEQLEQAGLRGEEALGLFGLRAGPGMSALVSIGSESLREMKEALENSQGEAKRIAEAMEQGLGGAMRRAKSASEGLKIALGEAFGKEIQAFVENTANRFLRMIVVVKQLQEDGTLKRWTDNVSYVLKTVWFNIQYTIWLFKDLIRVINALNKASTLDFSGAKEEIKNIGKEAKEWQEGNKLVEETYYKIDKATGQVIGTTKELITTREKERKSAAAALQETVKSYTDAIGRAQKEVEDLEEGIKDKIQEIFRTPIYETHLKAGLIALQATLAHENENIRGQYQQGKIDLETYYAERASIVTRRMQAEMEIIREQIRSSETQLDTISFEEKPEDYQKVLTQKAILNAELIAKEKELQTALLSLRNEGINEQDQINKQFERKEEQLNSLRLKAEQAFQDQKERLDVEKSGGGLTATFQKELADLQDRQNKEMELIREFHDKKIALLQEQKGKEKELEEAEKVKKEEELEQERMQQEEKTNLILDQQERAIQFRLTAVADIAGGMASILSDAYDLIGKENKELFYAMKAVAIAETLIKTSQAVMTAYATAGNVYVGAAMAAVVGAQGAMQIAKITSQSLAEGGIVEGSSPHPKSDDKLIAATSGEFMQPVNTVRLYGLDAMEAIRRRMVDRNTLRSVLGLGGFSAPAIRYGQRAYAEGGAVTPASGIGMAGDEPREEKPTNIINVLDPQVFQQWATSSPGQRNILNVISENSFEVKQILSQ